jgi:hypothetical protein
MSSDIERRVRFAEDTRELAILCERLGLASLILIPLTFLAFFVSGGFVVLLLLGSVMAGIGAIFTSLVVLARHFRHPDVRPVADRAIMGQACALFSLFLVIIVPNVLFGDHRHDPYGKNRCIANLRQIDGAKQQWALENKRLSADIPAISDIKPFLKNNVLPTCPANGNYILHAVSADPTCSVPGHTL